VQQQQLGDSMGTNDPNKNSLRKIQTELQELQDDTRRFEKFFNAAETTPETKEILNNFVKANRGEECIYGHHSHTKFAAPLKDNLREWVMQILKDTLSNHTGVILAASGAVSGAALVAHHRRSNEKWRLATLGPERVANYMQTSKIGPIEPPRWYIKFYYEDRSFQPRLRHAFRTKTHSGYSTSTRSCDGQGEGASDAPLPRVPTE